MSNPVWTGKHEFFSVHFSQRVSRNLWGMWVYADKPDGVMGPLRLQLSLWGGQGRAMPLFLLQQPWNTACSLDWLWKVIASTFIALGGKLLLSKGKSEKKKRIDILLPGNMGCVFRNEAMAKPHLYSHLSPCLLLFRRVSRPGLSLPSSCLFRSWRKESWKPYSSHNK